MWFCFFRHCFVWGMFHDWSRNYWPFRSTRFTHLFWMGSFNPFMSFLISVLRTAVCHFFMAFGIFLWFTNFDDLLGIFFLFFILWLTVRYTIFVVFSCMLNSKLVFFLAKIFYVPVRATTKMQDDALSYFDSILIRFCLFSNISCDFVYV